MARLFVKASSDYIDVGTTAQFSAPPFSVVCWFNMTNATQQHFLWTTSDLSNSLQSLAAFSARGNLGGDPLRASTVASTGVVADTSTGYSANTWHHAAAVYTSTASRAVYIDGGSKGTNTETRTPTGQDTTNIGAIRNGTGANDAGGSILAVTCWDSAIDDALVAELGAGRNPLTVSPFPVSHAPLTGGIHQIISGGPVNVNQGTTESDHIPMGW